MTIVGGKREVLIKQLLTKKKEYIKSASVFIGEFMILYGYEKESGSSPLSFCRLASPDPSFE